MLLQSSPDGRIANAAETGWEAAHVHLREPVKTTWRYGRESREGIDEQADPSQGSHSRSRSGSVLPAVRASPRGPVWAQGMGAQHVRSYVRS